jgi:ligand-binding sensor domain-containing protein/signal transduction histidine kinase
MINSLPKRSFTIIHRPFASLFLGCCLGVGALLGLPARAIDAEPQYWARTWQTDDGLPRNSITSIAQTPNGYLWFGTPFGIIRFDGRTFTAMEGESHEALARARTRVLYSDRSGRLWIGTGTMGIIRYDGKSFTLINYQNGLTHPTVSAICEDSEGTVWIGAQDGSIYWVDAKDQVHQIDSFQSDRLPDGVQLVQDRQGTLWFASQGAYGQLLNGTTTNITVTPYPFALLAPSRDGGMWVGAGNTVQKFSSAGAECEKLPSPAAPNQIASMLEDRSGNLWIGSPRAGLFRYSGGSCVLELSTARRIAGVYEDSESNIWVGTEGGGACRLRPRIFNQLAAPLDSNHSTLLSVCETEDGTRWLSAQKPSILRIAPNEEPASILTFTNIRVTSVLPNPKGGVWAGTVNWGLFEVSSNEATRVGNRQIFRGRQIRALHQDRRGDLWIGCLPDGLVKFSKGNMSSPQTFFNLGLPKQAVWAITDDSKGNLWLGTIGGEVWRYDGSTFTKFGETNGLPRASIGALHVTPEGDLWIGTMGGGLGRLRGNTAVFANTRQGLGDDVISSIVDDGLGNFWLSSDRGIVRVHKQELDEFADGMRDRLNAVCYGKDDGLANVECIGGYQPSAWRFASGEICFATSKGAVTVNPNSIPSSNSPPQLVLEKVLLDGRDVSDQPEPKLAYGYRNLDFKFTAPSFVSPERIRFRYQLMGLDADWAETDGVRTASYPRLAPGHYEFRFTARHLDGPWNETPLSFAFEVTPAYWQTVWFRGALLALFSVALAGAVRYRYVQKMKRKLRKLEQARAVEQERIRIARDIHDDLGARLTQMAFLSELAASQIGNSNEASGRLETISQASRQAIRSLDEIVWAVNPRKDSLPHLIDYLSHYANEFFRGSDTRCRQDLPIIVPEVGVSAEVRHHLFFACKEAMNNIQKHAHATDVWLRVTMGDDKLIIVIEDNGRGFQRHVGQDEGDGLLNLQNRLAAIGGECELDSQPGRGTCVRFTLKLKGLKANSSEPPNLS